MRIEPISKSFEKYRDAGELHKPEKIGGVVLPANEEAAFPLEPGKEPFNDQRRWYRRRSRPCWVLSLRVNRCGALRLLRPEVNPHSQFAVDGVVAFELRGESPFIQGDDAGDR